MQVAQLMEAASTFVEKDRARVVATIQKAEKRVEGDLLDAVSQAV